jgi:LmbE family N-acetylglucosaminyl deacetylase
VTGRTNPKRNILVVAPHPDDDIIGCGGSIARYIHHGFSVMVAYLTSGEEGSIDSTGKDVSSLREREVKAAADVLGHPDLEFLRMKDGYVQAYRQEGLTVLTRIIRQQRPSIIYFPHSREEHSDHKAAHDIVKEAARRAGGPWFAECGASPWRPDALLCYEVWTPIQNVSYIEDISPFMEVKMRALAQHQSQISSLPYEEATRALNRFRGITTGRGDYCECFEVLLISSFF